MGLELDQRLMARAVELARRGEGRVEPNPMVGCVIALGETIVGEGFHAQFGGPHAEVVALLHAGKRARGASLYVTLEPCCHTGKTPPCTEAVISAGVIRVVAAQMDPFPAVAGQGLAQLAAAGVAVETGLLADEAAELNAPYLRLVREGRPWVIAKWAMSLDGKLAARDGSSRWISSEAARAVVHALRGRMDAILIGAGTAAADDPLLTARPSGPRTPVRIVLCGGRSLRLESHLVRTARETPLLVVGDGRIDAAHRAALQAQGAEVLLLSAQGRQAQLAELLRELGRRRMTNILVEGGSTVLGEFRDGGWIDEVQAFVGPQLLGGREAKAPFGGEGAASLAESLRIDSIRCELLGDTVFISGRRARSC